MITAAHVTAAITRYLEALAAAQCCRSVSGQMVDAALLGCRVQGGLPAAPRYVQLVEAERPLYRCTSSEKRLFVEKYWTSSTQVCHEYVVNGARKERRLRVYRSDDAVAAAMGAASAGAVRHRLRVARAKVRKALEEMMGQTR